MSILNSLTSYVDMGSDASLDDIFDGGGSLGGWVDVATTGRSLFFARKGAGGAGWDFRRESGQSDKLAFYRYQLGGQAAGFWYADVVGTGLHHVMVTHADLNDPAIDPILYLDGVAGSSTEVNTPTGGSNSDASAELRIGNAYNNTYGVDGVLTDWRAYTRALTAAEVLRIYQCMGRDGLHDSMAGWWSMDELSDGSAVGSGVVRDRSVNGNHGTGFGSPTYAKQSFWRS